MLYLSNCQSISAGEFHSIALHPNGTLYAWGLNDAGQLGTSNFAYYNYPVQVISSIGWQSASAGERHTIGVKQDGTLWSWGANIFGQLGNMGSANQNAPVQISNDNTWLSVNSTGNSILCYSTKRSLMGLGLECFWSIRRWF